MTAAARKILDAALALSKEEREQLVEELVVSLHHEVNDEVETAWGAEATRRLESLERGETTAEDWESARHRLRAKHGFR